MVTMRSSLGTKAESAFSMVVLPVPVPPLMRTLSLAFTQAARKARHSASSEPIATRSRARSGAAPKRRMERTGPSMASGGMMAFTREPSGRRASTIGDVSSTRRPTRETMRLMMRSRWSSSAKRALVSSSLPPRSM